jgi:hypothetical protein
MAASTSVELVGGTDTWKTTTNFKVLLVPFVPFELFWTRLKLRVSRSSRMLQLNRRRLPVPFCFVCLNGCLLVCLFSCSFVRYFFALNV